MPAQSHTAPSARASAGWRFLALTALVVFAYCATGALGLALAVPPGYATAIWPPSGVALAALLLGGKRLSFGVWLGSLLLNVWVGASKGGPVGSTELLMALGIASGSTLQAYVGRTLVRRLLGFPHPLDTPLSVLKFFAAAGPLACLIASGISTSVLYGAGAIGPEQCAFTFTTWWVGDSMGVFLVTPLVLTFGLGGDEPWRKRRLTLALPVSAFLIVVTAAFLYVSRLEQKHTTMEFEKLAQGMWYGVAREFRGAAYATASVADLYAASERISRREFDIFARKLIARHAFIQAIEWLPRVPASELARHVQQTRAEGGADYRVFERDTAGTAVPVGQRDEYYPVHFVHPLPGNAAVTGFDLGSEPLRAAMLRRAHQTHSVAASVPLVPLQSQHSVAVLLAAPSYPQDDTTLPPQGFVLCVLRIEDVLRSVLDSARVRGVGLTLIDIAAPPAQQLLAAASTADPRASKLRSWHTQWEMGGRVWRLTCEADASLLRPEQFWLTWAMLVIGLCFAAVLGGFLLVTTGYAARAQALVAQRTRELAEANRELWLGIAQHEQAEAALAESEARWHFALDSAATGVWDWNTLTDQVYYSSGWKRVLGYAEHEIGVALSEWRSRMHPDDLPRCLADLERHLYGEAPSYEAELRMRHRDGSYVWVHQRGMVMARSPEGKPLRVIGTQANIHERKRVEQELALIHDGLEALVCERTRELELSRSAAEQANRAKSLFLTNMSHELRTPVHAVLSYANLGSDATTDPSVRDYFNRIGKSANSLLGLLSNLLDLSRFETAATRLELAVCDVEVLAREVVTQMQSTLASRHISLSFEVEAGSPTVLDIDRVRIAQVFRNVLTNAVRFSAPGARVVVRIRPVDGAGDDRGWKHPSNSALEIAFEDEGIGVPPGELDAIFEKFVQSSTTRSSAGGTGLGLAICREIMALHAGTIHARNNTGRGATFVVRLPVPTTNTRLQEAS